MHTRSLRTLLTCVLFVSLVLLSGTIDSGSIAVEEVGGHTQVHYVLGSELDREMIEQVLTEGGFNEK